VAFAVGGIACLVVAILAWNAHNRRLTTTMGIYAALAMANAAVSATRRYAATLRALGGAGVTRRRLGWQFWYGNPFAATHLVTASKPPHV
jgi:hypothetical protein